MNSFKDYHLKAYINQALDKKGFIKPTKVQELVFNEAFSNNQSLMVESTTGSGKTHSFLIPIIQAIDEDVKECQAVIFAPTRELAEQLYLNVLEITKESDKEINVQKVVGGSDRQTEIKKFESTIPQIVVGTIGRIHDLVITSNVLKIHNAKNIVIDEADMIFEDKEIVEVDHLMGKFLGEPRFLIFSATISKGLRSFLNTYFKNIKKIILEEKNLTNTNIEHLMLVCKAKSKITVLYELLEMINPYLCLIFVNTKDLVDSLALEIAENGYNVGKLHGDMDDRERKQMLRRINNLEFKYVVCSDIAARGIDIQGVSHVINYELPKDVEFYIHRTGRTARFDQTGQAWTLYSYDDDRYVKDLRNKGLIVKFVKLVNKEIIETKLERKTSHSFVKDIESRVHAKHKMPDKVKPGYKKKRKELIFLTFNSILY